MKQKKEAPQQPEVDEFHGQGGAYEIDETGKRRLVHRTELPQAAAQSTETKE